MFDRIEDIKSNLLQYFAPKGNKFYKQGIQNLPNRWEKVVQQDVEYITV